MNIERLKAELIVSLRKKLETYEERLNANIERKHEHIGLKSSASIVSRWVKDGVVTLTLVPLPSPLPFLWQIIGGCGGALMGVGMVCYAEIIHLRENHKIDNAGHVHDFMSRFQGIENENILQRLIEKIVNDRLAVLQRIKEEELNYVVEYLTVNIMKIIKHLDNAEERSIERVLLGLKNIRNFKENFHLLKDAEGHRVCTSSQLTQGLHADKGDKVKQLPNIFTENNRKMLNLVEIKSCLSP